jgi:hypothetical protein
MNWPDQSRAANPADASNDTPGDRFARLPKWAQQKLELLESNLATVTAERDAALDALGLTKADPYGPLRVPLGRSARFGLTTSTYVDVDPRGAGLTIRSNGGALVIRPQVSNSVTVDVER